MNENTIEIDVDSTLTREYKYYKASHVLDLEGETLALKALCQIGDSLKAIAEHTCGHDPTKAQA